MTKIARDDKIAAKDFLKTQVSKINMKGLSPNVKQAAEHILGQIDKWYLNNQPIKATKKTAAKKKKTATKK